MLEIKADAFAECSALTNIEFEHDSSDMLIIAEEAFMLSTMLETTIVCPDGEKPNGALKEYVWEYSGRFVEYKSK